VHLTSIDQYPDSIVGFAINILVLTCDSAIAVKNNTRRIEIIIFFICGLILF
jgi:hypothetical protein